MIIFKPASWHCCSKLGGPALVQRAKAMNGEQRRTCAKQLPLGSVGSGLLGGGSLGCQHFSSVGARSLFPCGVIWSKSAGWFPLLPRQRWVGALGSRNAFRRFVWTMSMISLEAFFGRIAFCMERCVLMMASPFPPPTKKKKKAGTTLHLTQKTSNSD